MPDDPRPSSRSAEPDVDLLSQDGLAIDTHQILAPDGSYDPDRVPDLSAEALTDLYRWMVLQRTYDERATKLQRRGRMGTLASGLGHEASVIGSVYALSPDDGFEQDAETVLTAYGGERVVYLTSPHNPTGSEFTNQAIVEIAEETDEETLVLVDEAYGEFTESESARRLIEERDDVAILRTFSKVYGLAGVRLGYGLVPEAWADAYARINTPFAASELACRAGLAALDDDDHVEQTVETARWAREYYHEHLDAPTWESGGNFVLAEVGDGSAVAEAAQHEGVIVRDCSSFGLPECIRITCGTREDTKRAVEVVNGVLD